MPLRLVIIAGPNGSGKSSLTDHGKLESYGLSLPELYINPDQIAKEMANADPTANEWDAWQKARALRVECRERRLSFTVETVLSHPSTLLDIRECRAAGYVACVRRAFCASVRFTRAILRRSSAR
jgi:predicted ABC-type ATPase